MDIAIYDNYSGIYKNVNIEKYKKDFLCIPYMVVIICQSGSAKYKFHYNEISLKRGSMILIPPKVHFITSQSDDEYKFDAMAIGESMFWLVDEVTVRPQFEHILGGVPTVKLSEAQLQMGHYVFNYIHELRQRYSEEDENGKKYIQKITEGYLKVMLLEACHMVSKADKSLNSHSKQALMTQKFFKDLSINFKNRENLSFYAKEAGVTPKRLSRIVKEQTGKTPIEWMDKFSILEAQKMLNTMDMTIQEISFDLNFATPSHFTKFFKHHCGMTPSEFRHHSEWRDYTSSDSEELKL